MLIRDTRIVEIEPQGNINQSSASRRYLLLYQVVLDTSLLSG